MPNKTDKKKREGKEKLTYSCKMFCVLTLLLPNIVLAYSRIFFSILTRVYSQETETKKNGKRTREHTFLKDRLCIIRNANYLDIFYYKDNKENRRFMF
jgi:hypothetical protein